MRKLRKLRIAICVFCENCEFLFCDFLFECISWNSDKMTIGNTRLTLVFFQAYPFWFIFTQIWNLKNAENLESSFDWPIFQKKTSNNNFRNFDLLENQIVWCCDCDRHQKTQLCYLRNYVFSQSQFRNYRNFRNPFYNTGLRMGFNCRRIEMRWIVAIFCNIIIGGRHFSEIRTQPEISNFKWSIYIIVLNNDSEL